VLVVQEVVLLLALALLDNLEDLQVLIVSRCLVEVMELLM
jgi:hypothetical protein